MFLAAVVSIVVALATGAAWIGQPFRAVQLVTLVGLSMTAGVSLMQALMRMRSEPTGARHGPTSGGTARNWHWALSRQADSDV